MFSFSQTIDPKKVRHVPLTDKIFFIQNLSIMVKAGIPLATALSTLAQEINHKGFRVVIAAVSEKLEKGTPFAASCAPYPHVFSELFVRMVESGELSGKLEEVLHEILNEMKKTHELISKVRGAMIYPAVIIFAMVGIGGAMIVFVIPKLTSIFQEVGANLPLPTRILIGISDFVIHHGIVVAFLLVGTFLTITKTLKTKMGKMVADKLLLAFPIFGGIAKKINLARFARTIGSLLKTDISIVESFKIASKTISNSEYRILLEQTSERLKKGVSVHEILKNSPKLFPPTVTQMIAVGEQSGTLDEILSELAEFYEEEIDQIMKNFPSVIEPVLILVLGLGVAGLAVSIILPMYSLSQQI